MKKIIIGGLVAGVVIWLVSMVFGSISADLYRMSPKIFWKPMGSAWMVQMVIFDFVTAFVLAYVYDVIKSAVPGAGYTKGLMFGLLVFLVGSFLGLSMTFLTMAIRTKLLMIWGLNGLVNDLLAGLTFQIIDERIE